MAEVVAAFGVPHAPSFPALVAKDPTCQTAQLFAEVAKHLDAVKPDVIVFFDSDHFNTFFLDNWPTFSIGVTETTSGPNDETPMMPRYVVPISESMAEHIRTQGITKGFDFSFTQEFEIDHSILVPLHFLTPSMNIPIVPIFINGLVPPLPAARRCFALGEMVRSAIANWPAHMRVAIMASGSFSLEVGGPRMHAGKTFGVPEPDWVMRVVRHIERAEVNQLLEAATSDQLAKAGNIGGELLNWISLLGVVESRRPVFIEPQVDLGNGYAAWRWD
jgi:aromatic ring-opening dioxygenase catalytic subunit (LigB family)